MKCVEGRQQTNVMVIDYFRFSGDLKREVFDEATLMSHLVSLQRGRANVFSSIVYDVNATVVAYSEQYQIFCHSGHSMYSLLAQYLNMHKVDLLFHIDHTDNNIFFTKEGELIRVLDTSKGKMMVYSIVEFKQCCWSIFTFPED